MRKVDMHEAKTHLSRLVDRMLPAQAGGEGLSLVTSDELVARYPGDVRKV